MARARRGDSAAIDALLRTHYDMIRAVCHRIVANKADAEDATQHALISIATALPRFDGRSKFSTWAYRIATNAALDEVRRIRRRPVPVDDVALAVDGQRGDDLSGSRFGDGPSAVESQIVVREALQSLPEDYRTALVLRHIADLEYEEIAVILEVPVGTVRSRLSRGRAQLADVLGNLEGSKERQNLGGEGQALSPGDQHHSLQGGGT